MFTGNQTCTVDRSFFSVSPAGIFSAGRPGSRILLWGVLTWLVLGLAGCEKDDKKGVNNSVPLSWQPSGGDMVAQTVQAIVIDPQDRACLYAGTLEGVFKSLDYGKTWTGSSLGLTSSDITSVAVSPVSRNLVFCGTWGKGLFKSSDAGKTWSRCWTNNQNQLILDVSAQPSGSGIRLWAGTAAGLYLSTDEGQTWALTGTFGTVNLIHSWSSDAQKLMISIDRFGLFRSVDGGVKWVVANNGIPSDSYGQAAARILCSAAPDSRTGFAVTDRDVLYRTNDGGDSWQSLAITKYYVPHFVGLCVEENTAGVVWLASRTAGVYKSSDAGANWDKINLGLENVELKTIAVCCAQRTVALVGTVGKGIFRYEE